MTNMISFVPSFLLAGDELQLIKGGAITVKNGQIISLEDVPDSAQRVDLPGRLICPMFINAHTHVGDSGAKELGIGLPHDQVVTPPQGLKHRFLNGLDDETHVAMMRHGLIEMLNNGVIACADFREQGLRGVRALRQAAQGLPLRVVALGRMNEAASTSEIEIEAHQILAEADGLGIRDVSSYAGETLKKLRQSYPNKIFAAHAAENLETEKRSLQETGLSQVARALRWHPDFLVHLLHASPGDFELMARQSIRAVSCPRSNGILGNGIPNLALWAQQGVRFGLGTDNVMFCSPDMLREMDYASRSARALAGNPACLDVQTLLKAATIEGARALRLDANLGSLAVGKEASFIVFNFQTPNLVYQHDAVSAVIHRASISDIEQIYIQGRPLAQVL